MKYIKTYEEDSSRVLAQGYWTVKTIQPNFSIALKKIGMSDLTIKSFVSLFDDDEPKINVYKTYNYEDDSYDWTWSEIYRKTTAKFMGEVEVSDFELDAYKYNL
jgi:hypothetical protein